LALLLLNPLVAFVSVPAAMVAALVVGLPAYLLLRRAGWLTPIGCTVAGVAAAAPFAAGFPLGGLLGMLTVTVGAIGGAVFWWAAVSEPSDPRAGHT
jgi:hypothetical protein